MRSTPALVDDLYAVLTHPDVPLECVQHLIDNASRLVRGVYEDGEGGGCVMFLLTESLPTERRIRSKSDLVRFFGRERGQVGKPGYLAAVESPEYQPAKWIVRAWDHQVCGQMRARYGVDAERPLPKWLLLAVARKVLAEGRAQAPPRAAAAKRTVQHSARPVPSTAG